MLHCLFVTGHRTNNRSAPPPPPLKSFMAAMPGDEFVISFSTEFLGLSISLCKRKWVVKNAIEHVARAQRSSNEEPSRAHQPTHRQRKGAEVDGISSDLLISFFIVVPSARNSIHPKPLSTRMIYHQQTYIDRKVRRIDMKIDNLCCYSARFGL